MLASPEICDTFDEFLQHDLEKDLLRFTTAGSVDDGKSTLIGRLLHDAKGIYEDQLASVKKSKLNRSTGPIDFSLLTDGLRAEREQGITIDVAYRFFQTARRKFIIADTPGHEQYTRNMATGASTAHLAVILIDATKGLLSKTRRHSYIAALLGIPNVLGAINKMDLMGYREEIFLQLQEDFLKLAAQLKVSAVQCVPVSALEGDNVVARSINMPWYSGPTFLEHLETASIRQMTEPAEVRFPVQYVIRPDATFRGFSGQLASGTLRPGDSLMALPSKQVTRVESIVTFDGELSQAIRSQSITLKLEDEIDLSRGDILVSVQNPPAISRNFLASLVWLHEKPLQLETTYLLKHTTHQVKAKIVSIQYRVDVNSLVSHPATELDMNGIALVEVQTSSPLFFDPYERSRATGSFILIDALSNATVGAGMIRETQTSTQTNPAVKESPGRRTENSEISIRERSARHGHRPGIFLVRNQNGLAQTAERALFAAGFETALVQANDFDRSSLKTIVNILWSLGIVILLVVADDTSATQFTTGSFTSESLFDYSSSSTEAESEEALADILLRAESLLLESTSRDAEREY
jgi:sulfate adenylyltransferase large subunit